MACPNSCSAMLQTSTTMMMIKCWGLKCERSNIRCLRPFLSGRGQDGTQAGRHPLPADQVFQTLSLDNEIRVALINQNDGGPQEPVIVARHRMIVGSGRL